MYYVYILQNVANEDDIYIGYSANLKQRFAQHNRGENTSTRGRTWRILYYEAYPRERVARDRERKLKAHGRSKQLLLDRVRE